MWHGRRPVAGRWLVAILLVALNGCSGAPGSSPVRPASSGVAAASTSGSSASPVRTPVATPGIDVGPGEPWIAYQARAANGGYGVHLVRPDGTGNHWATAKLPGQFQEHPDWSPDGDRLAFSVTDADQTEDLWVADVDGSNAVRIVNCQAPCVWADEPAWSPDGRSIVFQRMSASDAKRTSTIELWDVKTQLSRVLVSAAIGKSFYAPRWAPDGHALVVEHAADGRTVDDAPVANAIAIVNLIGAPTVRELTDPKRLANNPDWSPRGDLIVFSLPAPGVGFDGPSDLYAIAPAGGAMRRLTSVGEAGGTAVQPTFSPDGLSVLFVVGGRGATNQGLAVVSSTGGRVASATTSGYIRGVHPRLRPTP